MFWSISPLPSQKMDFTQWGWWRAHLRGGIRGITLNILKSLPKLESKEWLLLQKARSIGEKWTLQNLEASSWIKFLSQHKGCCSIYVSEGVSVQCGAACHWNNDVWCHSDVPTTILAFPREFHGKMKQQRGALAHNTQSVLKRNAVLKDGTQSILSHCCATVLWNWFGNNSREWRSRGDFPARWSSMDSCSIVVHLHRSAMTSKRLMLVVGWTNKCHSVDIYLRTHRRMSRSCILTDAHWLFQLCFKRSEWTGFEHSSMDNSSESYLGKLYTRTRSWSEYCLASL